MCTPVHCSTVHGSSMDGIIDGGSRSESDRRNNSLFTTTVVQLIFPRFLFSPLFSLSLCSFSSSSCSRIANVLTHCRGKHPVEGETRNRLLFPFKLFFLPPSLPLLSLTILLTKKEKKKQKRKKLRLSLILSRVSFLPCTHYYIVTSFDAASTVSNIIDPPPKSSFLPLWRCLNDRERGAKLKAERKREEDKIPLFQESFILCPSSNNRRKISAKERRDNPPGDLTHSQSPFSNAG